MQSESLIETEASFYAGTKGMLSLKLNVRGRVGWPDRLFIYKGKVFFIEFKAPGEVPRKVQTYIHNMIKSHYIEVFVVDSLDQAKEIIDEQVRLQTVC
jgi:hypothetical protein